MALLKMIKVVVIIFVVVAAIASLYLYKEYNRKPSDLTDIMPAENTTAAALVTQYNTDEEKANQKYLGKTIQVAGPIAEINNQQDTLIAIAIGNSDDIHKVNCLLDRHSFKDVKRYVVGQPIIIKGICTGFLIDIELNRCVIIADNK